LVTKKKNQHTHTLNRWSTRAVLLLVMLLIKKETHWGCSVVKGMTERKKWSPQHMVGRLVVV